MKILAILLSLILSLPSGGITLTLTAENSDIFSAGALEALNALLAESSLTVSASGYDLNVAEEPLLRARMDGTDGVIACGEAAAPLTAELSAAGSVWEAAEALGALLADWEKETGQSVDLQEAGTARRLLTYALTGEEWAAVWPQVMEILCAVTPEAQALAELEITGKGTFKRYFDRDGQEMGAYFYAASAKLNGVTRELRLEYGAAPQKGLYIAFRCPAARGSSNIRLSLHAKNREGAYTVKGELRRTESGLTEVWSAEGRTDGALHLSVSRTADGKTVSRGLTLTRTEEGASYALENGRQTWLAGRAAWQAAELPDAELPAPIGEIARVGETLAERLLALLRAQAPDTWQQLVHYLATNALIDLQREVEN